jgi:nucleoside phosphorylase
MALQWLFRSWLASAAKQKVYEAAEEAVREQLRQRQAAEDADRPALPPPCDVGFVFATPQELGGLYDLLSEVTTITGDGFVTHLGSLRGRRVAAVVCGSRLGQVRRGTQALIDGHHPRYVIAAGFADALKEGLKLGDAVLADQVIGVQGERVPLELPADIGVPRMRGHLHVGGVLTVDQGELSPADREELGRRYGGLALDHESLAVAEVCRQQRVSCLTVRVVRTGLRDELPRDVRHFNKQHSIAGRLGAALGTVVRRPGSVKDMWQWKEDALVASDRLAKVLDTLVLRLPFPT